MNAKKSILNIITALFLVSFLLLSTGSVKAQNPQGVTVCGYLYGDPSNKAKFYFTTYGIPKLTGFWSIELFDNKTGWVELSGAIVDQFGRIDGFSSYRRVEGCTNKTNIKNRAANTVLPLSPVCSSKATLTIDKTGMAGDWQKAIASAAMTWGQSGSKLVISYAAVKDSQRTFTLLDYEGKTIDIDKQPFTLALCEVRVVLASRLPSTYIKSFERSLISVGVGDYSTMGLAGWVQPFSTDGKYSNAALLVINDKGNARLSSTTTGLLILDVETLALHELGHAFGLNHIKGVGSTTSGDFIDDVTGFGSAMSAGTLDHLMKLGGGTQRNLSSEDKNAIKKAFGSIAFEKFNGSKIYLTSPRMHGDGVLKLQHRLLDLGYSEVGLPDGWFGPLTETAVKRFQSRNGLSSDGIVNENVWNLIFAKP